MAFTPSLYGQGMLLTGLTTGTTSPLVATITKDSFPTSALDTGSTSCLNGGGDWVFSTDSGGANQLPCKIVRCVTSATPSSTEFEVKIRFAAYASGTREVYAFWNRAGQSQPAAGASFGSQEVFQDYELAILQGSVVDETGNHTPVLNGSPSLATMMWGGQGYNLVSTGQNITVPHAVSLNIEKDFSLDIWSNATAPAGSGIYWDKTNNNTSGYRLLRYSVFRSRHVNLSGANLDSPSVDGLHREGSGMDGTTRELYRDGVTLGSDTPAGTVTNNTSDVYIGSQDTGDNPINGVLGDLYLAIPARTADRPTEYSNQLDPATFWTAGTVFVPGGGGTITVTGATANYNYSAIAGSIDLTGLISVVGSTPNYAYAPISGTIDLTPQITVTGATPNYTYTAIAGTVETPGTISVTGVTPNYTYSPVAGTITLFGTITVTGLTANYNYNAVRGVIQFGENVYTNSFVGFVPDQGVFSGVVKSATFSGIISETSDFSGYAKATTFLGVKQ